MGSLGGMDVGDEEEKRMLSLIGDDGWLICNGNIRGDEEGEFTFVGKRQTVIDYVIADDKVRSKMRSIKVDREVRSEYFPLIVEMVTEKRVKREIGIDKERRKRLRKMGKWGRYKLMEFGWRM